MSDTFKLWLSVPIAARHIGVPKDGLYRDIRRGVCPFRTEVISGRIHISARDIGLIPPNEPQNEEAQSQVNFDETACDYALSR